MEISNQIEKFRRNSINHRGGLKTINHCEGLATIREVLDGRYYAGL